MTRSEQDTEKERKEKKKKARPLANFSGWLPDPITFKIKELNLKIGLID